MNKATYTCTRREEPLCFTSGVGNLKAQMELWIVVALM